MSEPAIVTIDELRTRREELSLREETALLQAEVRALEQSRSLYEGWGDLVDPLEWMTDDSTFSGLRYGNTISKRSDREHGHNYPVFQNETELASIRGAARAIYDAYPVALNAMENLLSFVLGEGISVKPIPRAGAPRGLADAVADCLGDFFAANHWIGFKQEERFIRWLRDGELFDGLWPDGNGRVSHRFIEPEEVTEPMSPRDIEDWLGCDNPSDWTYGIHADADDMETVHGYYCQWSDTPTNWDYLPAERVHHAKRNVDSRIKRGLSDFYAVQSYLVNTGKLDRNVALGAAILSAIIGIREHGQNTTQSAVQAMIQANAYRTRTVSTPLGSSTRYDMRVSPGSFLDMSRGVTYKQSPLANQGVGEAFVTIKQALLRTIGARWCMPEYLISGDASNANYASTLVAESPFIKFGKRQQRKFCVEEEALYWKVLAFACRAGRFRKWGIWLPGELAALVSLQVTGPIVEARDRPAETTRRKTLWEAGVLSADTWASEEGYDPETEKTKGAAVRVLGGAAIGAGSAGTGAAVAAGAPTKPGEEVATAKSEQDIQVSPELMLNGAQVTAATAIVTAVAKGEIPRDTGLGQLQVLFNLTAEQAAKIMGSAGTEAPTTPNPKPITAGEVGQAAVTRESRLQAAAVLLREGYP